MPVGAGRRTVNIEPENRRRTANGRKMLGAAADGRLRRSLGLVYGPPEWRYAVIV